MSATAEKSEEKKKGGLPMPIIIGVVAVLIGLFLGKSVLGGSKAEAKDKKKVVQEAGPTLALDEFLVNLTGGNDHYLRTTISLGLRKETKEEEMKEKTALLRDSILTVLRSKKLTDLTKENSSEKLKEELKKSMNDALGDDIIQKVYFTAFATQ